MPAQKFDLQKFDIDLRHAKSKEKGSMKWSRQFTCQESEKSDLDL